MRIRMTLLLLPAFSLGCSEPQLGPEAVPDAAFIRAGELARTNAAVHWNAVARDLVIKHAASPYHAVRGYALLSIAQYNGAVVANDRPRRHARAAVRAAITRASVDVLSYLHPTEAPALEHLAEQFLAGERRELARAGQAAGAAAAAAIIVRASADDFFVPWTGTVPVGEGLWFSSVDPPAPPVLPLLGEARPFLLLSGNQFRPPPPPEFGSPEFAAALAEVRRIADTRTAEQDAIAKFWAFPAGTYGPPGYWNEEASRLAVRFRLSELKTAHLLAVMNMVGADALIAGHDAKYAYWLIRPSQADPAIQLAIGLPNFPSYVSNHAAVSGGMAGIIGKWFPSQRRRLHGLAEQAAASRLYGGIHYRFDNDAGLRLGRRIAEWALDHDVRDGQALVLR